MHEGELCQVHDHLPRAWRHLDFFEHTCYLHAGVPRVKTKEGKVRAIEVPLAGAGSPFTLLFEQKVLDLVRMSASKIGKTMGIDSRVVSRTCKKYVMNAIAWVPIEPVKHAGLDGTSYKNGHKYLTVLIDKDRKKVVGIGTGKDAKALEGCLLEMEIRGGDRSSIKSVTMDMSPAYISGVQQLVPETAIVFDRFHLMLNLNNCIDEIRKRGQKEFSELKNTKYLWLKKRYGLSEEKAALVAILADKYQDVGRAYQLKEQFRATPCHTKEDHKTKWLRGWMKLAYSTQVQGLQGFVKMLEKHWYGIKTYFKYLSTNGYSERINLTIQEIKRIGKGYRDLEGFKVMAHLHSGGIDFSNPH